MNGDLVASAGNFWGVIHTAVMNYGPTGTQYTGAMVWTGSSANGTVQNECNSWANNASNACGTAGDGDATDSTVFSNGVNPSCDTANLRVYCISQ